MKNIAKTCFGLLTLMMCLTLGACSDFEPEGTPEVPSLAKVSDLKATVNGHDIDLSWVLPNAAGIEGVVVTTTPKAHRPSNSAPTPRHTPSKASPWKKSTFIPSK